MTALPPDYKPTAADQFWRLSLSGKNLYQLEREARQSIKDGQAWRLWVVLQMPMDLSSLGDLLQETIEANQPALFDMIAEKYPDWKDILRTSDLDALLSSATKMSNIAMFEKVSKVYPVDFTGEDGNYFLGLAAGNGQLEMIKYFMSKGANPADQDADSVLRAVTTGHLDIVKYIFEHADIDIAVDDNCLIRNAVTYANFDIAAYLVEKGAQLEGEELTEALESAAILLNGGFLKAAIEKFTITDADWSSVLEAIIDAEEPAAIPLLQSLGVNLDLQSSSALRSTIYLDDTQMLEAFLKAGTSPDGVFQGVTHLADAIDSDRLDMVKMLLAYGADPLLHGKCALVAAESLAGDADAEHGAEILRLVKQACADKIADINAQKLAEFKATFTGNYTLDDLRHKAGPSGDCGLLLAAKSGQFGVCLGPAIARDGKTITLDDFFHPALGPETVMSVLILHGHLQQAFVPEIWVEHMADLKKMVDAMPPEITAQISLQAINAERTRLNIEKKGRLPRPPLGLG